MITFDDQPSEGIPDSVIDPSLRDPTPASASGVETATSRVDVNHSVASSSPAGRAKLACQPCRSNKIRCVRHEGDHKPCARCMRFKLDCVLPPVNKPRGRPPKGSDRSVSFGEQTSNPYQIPQTGGRHSTSQENKIQTNYFPRSNSNPFGVHSRPSISPSEPGPGPSTMSRQPTFPDQRPHNHQDSRTAFYNRQPQSLLPVPLSSDIPPLITPTSKSSNPESTPRGSQINMDFSEYLDPQDRIKPQAPFFHNAPVSTLSGKKMSVGTVDVLGPGKQEGDDPISLFILSTAEAHALVHLFHERLNPHVAVLDQHLHTVEYLRRTSTVLFTAVLACSAGFFRKDLHPMLLSHAQTILDRALIGGVTEIGIVQSLMVLTYWKRPDDTSAWRKIGMAIRMGYQLYWHIKRVEALPDDELAARQILNGERTWYCLFCFDRGLSQTIGLPTAMRLNEIGDPDAWAREHLHLGHLVDMHLAASIELCKLKDHWRAIFEDTESSPSFAEAVIESTTLQAESLLAKWTTKGPTIPDFDQEHEHVVVWSILDFCLILKRHHLALAPSDIQRIDRCLALASRIVDIIEICAGNGSLVIMQDTASCMTSSLVVFLRKTFGQCARSQKNLIVSLLQRTLLSHTRVSEGNPAIATAYVARFVRRILGVLGQESRTSSPRLGAAALETTGGVGQQIPNGSLSMNRNNMSGLEVGNGQPDFMAELEQFMQNPDNMVQPDLSDEQYWTMLFSADPNTSSSNTTDDFMALMGI